MLYIENERFRLGAVSTGAELRSFVDKTGGDYEYLWQGGEIWNGCSPLLFPVVGKLKDDSYTLNGTPWKLEKHGFARKTDFAVEEHTAESITFIMTDSEATRRSYPFAFALRVTFALTETGFAMTHRVKNTGGETMHFSLGAHPGFQCDMGDVLVMDEPETAAAYKLDENFLRGAVQQPVFDASRELVITPELFEKDALIFDGLRSRGCTLRRAAGRNVHVDFGGAPCLGVWAKPAAPYVCIEPWYGIDDAWNAGGELAQKYRIQSLAAGEEFVFTVTVDV